MSVVNGELVEATLVNSRFVSRTTDSDTIGIVGLNNSAPASGAVVSNIQGYANELADTVGQSNYLDANRKQYSSNEVVADGDNRKVAIEKLDAKFNNVTGHAHSGASGDGSPISALNLTNINKYFAEWQGFTKTGVSGASTVITTEMSGKSPNGGASATGVITVAPNNKASIFNATDGSALEDVFGNKIYGRITESSGVWTLTYYKFSGGVESAESIGSATDIQVFFLEVFNLNSRPTIPSTPEFGSLNISADVIDATSSLRGLVSTGGQTFGGKKQFDDGAAFLSALELFQTDDSGPTGANQTLNLGDPFMVLTNNALTSVAGISSDATNKFVIFLNKTGASITLKHDSASASVANRILIPGATDIDWDNNSAFCFVYDTTVSKWALAGGGAGGANKFLSNLSSPTSVNQSLIPSADATKDIGSSLLRWAIGYFSELKLASGTSDIDILPAEISFNDTSIPVSSKVFLYSGSLPSGEGGYLSHKIDTSYGDGLPFWINSNYKIFLTSLGDIWLQPGNGFLIQAKESIGLNNQKAVRFYDSDNSNYSGFKAHATTTQNREYILPPADGSSGQALSTDGAGNLSWVSATGTLSATTKTANYTILTTDNIILANPTSGDITLTLPAVASAIGKTFTVKRTHGGANFLKVTSASNIDGATDSFIDNQYDFVNYYSDGSTYWTI